MSSEDRALIYRALRFPRGRYTAQRAAELSAVPQRTLHDWATSGALVPDWMHASPRGWPYRDVVYVRMLAWLRSKRMERSEAAERVQMVRELVVTAPIDPQVRSDGSMFLIGAENEDRFTGQQAFDGLNELLDVFHLTEPIEGISESDLWGPSLVHPSAHTCISPWVLHGEPCVEASRVPSASLYSLHVERGLDDAQIVALYPGLNAEAVQDAIQLEQRLRAAA